MRRFLALLLLPMLACGSDTPTAPGGFSGTYALEAIEAQALPYIDHIAAMTMDTLYIVAGEVRVLSRGRASVVRTTRWHTTSNGVAPATHDTAIVTWAGRGDTVLLTYPPASFGGAYTDTALVAGSTLQVRTLVNRGNLGRFHRLQTYRRR